MSINPSSDAFITRDIIRFTIFIYIVFLQTIKQFVLAKIPKKDPRAYVVSFLVETVLTKVCAKAFLILSVPVGLH